MTNEELFDELEDVLRECSEYFPKCDTEIYDVDSAFNKLKKRLTKYKRAFEILKEELNIDLGKEEHTFKDFKDIYYYMSIRPVWQDTRTTFELSQNEYELLEELMKDDNQNGTN